MSSNLYIEISNLNISTTRNCPHKILATIWEICTAVSCSIICSSYIIRTEERTNPGLYAFLHLPSADGGLFSWYLEPSPAVMLAACIILGCAVSSFAYRRHESDRYQIPVFLLALSAALFVGACRSYHVDFVVLGLLPWAACAAMVLSVSVHNFGRRCCARNGFEIDCYVRCEKGQIVPKA